MTEASDRPARTSDEPSGGSVEELSFDDALARLEKAASELESGEIPLEQALAVYESAVRLFRHCNQRLLDAEKRLEILTRDLDGTPRTRPLDAGAELGDDG